MSQILILPSVPAPKKHSVKVNSFFFKTTLLWCNLHIIKLTCFLCIALSDKFTELCSRHYFPGLEHSHHPNKISHAHFQLISILIPALGNRLPKILCICIESPFLSFSGKWNYTVCGLLCLVSLIVFRSVLIVAYFRTSLLFIDEF